MSKVNRPEYWEIINCVHEHNINPVTREIYIGGWPTNMSDEEVGVDHQMACELIRNISFLENQSNEPILIHMCTIGGEIRYGMAIYDAIHECSCPVTIRAYAHARSMSSIIIQAADHRQMLPNCQYMIHEGHMYIDDTVKGAKSYIEISDKDEQRMIDIYVERSSLKAKQIQDKMDRKQEWYMSAEEALELGLIDEIYSRT